MPLATGLEIGMIAIELGSREVAAVAPGLGLLWGMPEEGMLQQGRQQAPAKQRHGGPTLSFPDVGTHEPEPLHTRLTAHIVSDHR